MFDIYAAREQELASILLACRSDAFKTLNPVKSRLSVTFPLKTGLAGTYWALANALDSKMTG